jgi:manganese/zinc/iron transport system substrate-binding protein
VPIAQRFLRLNRAIIAAVGLLFSPLLHADAPLKVVVTTNIIEDLVAQIGGNKIQLSALMQTGIDPHYYRATFGDMRLLARADVVFYNGLGLEGRMQNVFNNLSAIKPVFALSDAFPNPIFEQGVADPHIWLDVRIWRLAAHYVRSQLSQLRPQHDAYFLQRWQAYDQQLAELDEWIKQQLQAIPHTQRVLISAHDAFGYYGAAYDIEVMGLQGINTTAEYGLKDINQLKQIIKSRQIKAVFIESTLPKRSIQALIAGIEAEGGHLTLGGELYTDSLGEADSPAPNYIAMMRHNTRTLVEALK